jgi:hypothetical protein
VAFGCQNNNPAIDVEREGLLGIKQRTTWSKAKPLSKPKIIYRECVSYQSEAPLVVAGLW